MKKIIITILFMSALFSQGNDRYGTFISTWYDAILMATDTTANGVIGGQWLQDGRGNLTNICIDGINGRTGFGKLSPEFNVDVFGILHADSLMGDTVIVNYLLLPDIHLGAEIGTETNRFNNIHSDNMQIEYYLIHNNDGTGQNTYIGFDSDNHIILKAGNYANITMAGTPASGASGNHWIKFGTLNSNVDFIFENMATWDKENRQLTFTTSSDIIMSSAGYIDSPKYIVNGNTDFNFIVFADTLCSIFSTDTLRIHPSR